MSSFSSAGDGAYRFCSVASASARLRLYTIIDSISNHCIVSQKWDTRNALQSSGKLHCYSLLFVTSAEMFIGLFGMREQWWTVNLYLKQYRQHHRGSCSHFPILSPCGREHRVLNAPSLVPKHTNTQKQIYVQTCSCIIQYTILHLCELSHETTELPLTRQNRYSVSIARWMTGLLQSLLLQLLLKCLQEQSGSATVSQTCYAEIAGGKPRV